MIRSSIARAVSRLVARRIAQGLVDDKGPLIGSTTHLIGSTEGFIGNRLPSTQN